MFVLDEKVIYPGYGLAVISRLVERLIVDKKTNFFEYPKTMWIIN